MPEETEKLNTTEFAARAGVSRVRVLAWIREGRIHAEKPGGRDWMISTAELERPEVKERKWGWPKGKSRGPRPPRAPKQQTKETA